MKVNTILYNFLQERKEHHRVTRGVRTLVGWRVFSADGSELLRRPLPEVRNYAQTINARLIKAEYRALA
jgi:hypothetical protein